MITRGDGIQTIKPGQTMRRLPLFTTLVLSIFLVDYAAGQSDPGSLLKAGGLPYFNRFGYGGFSLHAEFETAFNRTPFLTSGPRVDFITSPNNNYSLILAYDLKAYPLYKKSRGPYRGPFFWY